MSELVKSNSLFISVIGDNEASKHYYFSKNTNNILKFFNSPAQIYYSPSFLSCSLVSQQYSEEENLLNAEITLTVIGIDENKKEYTDIYTFIQKSSKEKLEYIFPASVENSEQKKNITKVILSAKYNNIEIAYEELLVFYGTNESMAKFALKAEGVYMSMQDAGLIFDASGLTINGGGFTIKNKKNEKIFQIDESGNLFYQGSIWSSSGEISGWKLTENELLDSRERVGIHSGNSRFYGEDVSPVRFWAGSPGVDISAIAINNEPIYTFAVTQNGTLYATDARIIGSIEATSGRILNNFYVGENNNSGIIIYGGDESTKSYIGSARYASGQLGGGWTINSDGSAEFNNVSVRGKITTSVFEQQHISSVGGSLYIAHTIYTTTNSALIEKIYNTEDVIYTTNWTLNNTINEAFGNLDLQIGDQLLIDGNVFVEAIDENQSKVFNLVHVSGVFMTVISLETDTGFSAPNIFQVSFSTAENLGNFAYFQPGAAIVFYGRANERNGLYLTAMGLNAPYLEIYSADSKNQVVPAVRLGNLLGITDSSFGTNSNLNGYGLYSNNAYLRGQLMLPKAGVTNQDIIMKDNSPVRFWAGKESFEEIADANFVVTEDGSLYAKRGIFEGIVKATNSEFSGNIRAAGILLEQKDISTDDALHNHFYVAYNILENGDFIPSYKNYLLNIDANGLSIWEGGLQAYSDYANGELPGGNFQETQLAWKAYSALNNEESALPFLYLIDNGKPERLESRLVSNKIHTISFVAKQDLINNTSFYSVKSLSLDDGIWFSNLKEPIGSLTNCKQLEQTLFDKEKNTGISLSELQLSTSYFYPFIITNTFSETSLISLQSSKGIYINNKKEDIPEYYNNALFVRGNVQITAENEAELKIGQTIISEVKDSNNKTLGINFIAMS